MIKTINILKISVILLLAFSACSKKDNPVYSGEQTVPVITSLTADKYQIVTGGVDLATITCNATGGNLKFKWEVDLGDILQISDDNSVVSFSGAKCCVGQKTIKCTVSNDKGSVTKNIIITLLEEIKQPEVISIEPQEDITLHYSNNESAILTCNAIGGNLKYKWTADCGTITNSDSANCTFKPGENCPNPTTVTCTVSNEKGTASDNKKITVVK